jgi:hypothetical protein
MKAIRFSRQKATIPTSWTFPGTGEHEGAQVWEPADAAGVMDNGGDAPGWTDGYDYNPKNGYNHVLILDVDGTSGERGPLEWDAVTESDVNAAYMLDYPTAKKVVEELPIELLEDGEIECGMYEIPTVDDWMEHASRLVDALIDAADEVEPTFERTITDAAVEK